jgi:phasin family protein
MSATTKKIPALPAPEVTAPVANMAADSTAQAQKMFADGTAQARAALEKGVEEAQKAAAQMVKASEDAMAFGKGNMEAFTQAAQFYFTGMQDLSRQAIASAQSLSEQTIEGVKAMSAAKSLKDVTELQTTLFRTAFEKSVADMKALHEASVKLAEGSFAPISARFTLAVEKFAKPVAA